MEKILPILDELWDTLTFKRTALIALLLAMGLGLYFSFENRNVIFNKLFNTQLESPVISSWELSDTSRNALINFTKNVPISILTVVDVDLKKNRRVAKFRYSPNENIRKHLEERGMLILPQAFFDHDPKNTQQMVAVLSNEFNCVKAPDAIQQRLYPDLAPSLAVVCRIAIPPFTGQFVGYLSISFARELSKNELDSIRLEATRLAIEIYTRDVLKNNN